MPAKIDKKTMTPKCLKALIESENERNCAWTGDDQHPVITGK